MLRPEDHKPSNKKMKKKSIIINTKFDSIEESKMNSELTSKIRTLINSDSNEELIEILINFVEKNIESDPHKDLS
jgi:sugar diacid utilization regulator